MDKYNSLTEQLIQSGILPQSAQNPLNTENFFESPTKELIEAEKIIDNDIERKRINQLDLDFLEDDDKKYQALSKNPLSRLKNILKKDEQKVLFKLFPNLEKAKIAKETVEKISKLNIDTKKLLDKSIPYGEKETRYKTLVKYLSVVNEVQSRIKNN